MRCTSASVRTSARYTSGRALGLLDGCLTFAGRQREPARYFAAADASLLTSVAEGCPNVALESQALGVPIVLTRAAGSPEAVLDGVTGFVCEVGDIDALAARLADLADHPDAARAMGERGRPFIAERFSIARMVAETSAVHA
ncbi:MAG: glycosyltransferase [Deltaproteobacteria bacterium]|nr:glycosyltransferase [Deltaproteobacteria bacterium]